MMERRRDLKIPFTVDKDNLMESPFGIPLTCVSSENGKFEKQVSWTELSGRKLGRCDSHHKNGSTLFGHNHAAKVTLEMGRRKPLVILTDVLKSEKGKDYIDKMKCSRALGNRGQVSSMQKELGGSRESPPNCRDSRSSQRLARSEKNTSVTAKCNQKTTWPSSQRSRLRRGSQNVDDEVDKGEKDIEEVIIGKDCGEDYTFAEVVDCGLSVSWKPTGGCDEFSPTRIKGKLTDPDKEVHGSLNMKRKIRESQCNGTGSPKRHRESVLRLTREDVSDGEPVPSPAYLEEGGEDLESLDRSILQFTVGDERTDVLVPVINANLETGDLFGTGIPSLSSSQDNAAKTGHSEPIVLSSDDEESCDVAQYCSTGVHSVVAVGDTVIQEAVGKQQEPSDTENIQLLRVVVEDLPPVAGFSNVEYPGMGLAFSNLYCGAHQGKSNGDIVLTEQQIIIPLKDLSDQVEMMLTIERKQLRRYSVWEQQELEAQDLHFKCDEEPFPPSILLLLVSEPAAAAAQRDLRKLCVHHDETTNTADKMSPFILLTLRDPLEGMEGALLRSLLDIDCLSSCAKSFSSHEDHLEDFDSPVLSLDDSIELIIRSGLDPNLLSALGLKDTDPQLNTDSERRYSDTDKSTSPPIQQEVDSRQETILEVETATEGARGTQHEPEEDHKEQEVEHPPEKRKEEPTPAYTLCHRRTEASYSVSMCKPDSSWTKYKHKGLTHRLIQFPPPPLKGGITVTMEDLQCLDRGQFLNDVIIDFYLKYLLHKASAAVTERSHIFSSFFYKQLTRRDNASEGNAKDSCQRQRRHQRVKTWTRHVDIFKKDFLFVPVNQEAHWYLVVICFPGLHEPTFQAWNSPNSQTGKTESGTGESQEQDVAQGYESPNDNTETPTTPPTLNYDDGVDTEAGDTQEESNKDQKPGPVSSTERTFQKKTVCKRPCILVMDSLKRSSHERVFKLLRDYLESEWEVRRGSWREFNADQMQSSHCKVPLQDNSSDCGLYLLQYVESFLEDPVVHFDLPLQLHRWFPRQQVRRKRDEIRNLVLNLYRCQNVDSNR